LGTALSSTGIGHGPTKGSLLGTNRAIDREGAKVDKMINLIYRGGKKAGDATAEWQAAMEVLILVGSRDASSPHDLSRGKKYRSAMNVAA
jgi:hypothetical protein